METLHTLTHNVFEIRAGAQRTVDQKTVLPSDETGQIALQIAANLSL